MAAYNAGSTIDRAVTSVLGQTYIDFELIIIDDCSTDDTLQRAESYVDTFSVVVLSTNRNRGPGFARNLGISAAKGAWIAIIDADDAWSEWRLETILKHDNCDVIVDNLLGTERESSSKPFAIFPEIQKTKVSIGDILIKSNNDYDFGYLKPVFKKSLSAELSYNETLRAGEDYVLLLSMALFGLRIVMIPDAGYIYTLPSRSRARLLKATSVPDPQLPVVLNRILAKYRPILNPHELAAFENKIRKFQLQVDYQRALSYAQSYDLCGLFRNRRYLLAIVSVIGAKFGRKLRLWRVG